MTTPIERLRKRHQLWDMPEKPNVCTCTECAEPWPCDTVAALDALQARLDAATELIRQTMEELHGWHEWVAGEGGAPIVCPDCGPFREWLEGEGR